MNYIIKEAEDIFSDEFVAYMASGDLDKNLIKLMMNKISAYESKHNLEFVNVFANQFIIFREI